MIIHHSISRSLPAAGSNRPVFTVVLLKDASLGTVSAVPPPSSSALGPNYSELSAFDGCSDAPLPTSSYSSWLFRLRPFFLLYLILTKNAAMIASVNAMPPILALTVIPAIVAELGPVGVEIDEGSVMGVIRVILLVYMYQLMLAAIHIVIHMNEVIPSMV
jgi:hypothetical protein